MESVDDELVLSMIAEARRAGAYHAEIRRDPALLSGYGKSAERHRAAVKRLCDEICRQAATRMGMSAAAAFGLGRSGR